MLAIVFATLLQAPVQPADQIALPVSVDRIRKGLAQPRSRFEPPPPRAFRGIFRVKIEAFEAFTEKPWERDLPVPPWVRPLAPPAHFEFLQSVTPVEFRGATLHPCCNVSPVISAVSSFVGDQIRSVKQRRAQREVERAMRDAGLFRK
jgi:hypothetical protein